jgi:hypothetical protein
MDWFKPAWKEIHCNDKLKMESAAWIVLVTQFIAKMFLSPVTKYALPPSQVTCLPVVWRLLFVRYLEGSGGGLIKLGAIISAFGWRD